MINIALVKEFSLFLALFYLIAIKNIHFNSQKSNRMRMSIASIMKMKNYLFSEKDVKK
jgi:hypothetical protein